MRYESLTALELVGASIMDYVVENVRYEALRKDALSATITLGEKSGGLFNIIARVESLTSGIPISSVIRELEIQHRIRRSFGG